MLDWFFIEEVAADEAEEPAPVGMSAPPLEAAGEQGWPARAQAQDATGLAAEATPAGAAEGGAAPAPPPPYSRRAPRPRRASSIAAWVVAVLALGVVGVVMAKGLPHHAAPAVQLTATATATATAPATPAATATQRAAAVREAARAASNATRSASAAEAVAKRVSGLLASAQRDAKRVTAVASVELARNPGAKSPSTALKALQQVIVQADKAVNAIESDATAADGAANAAASIAESIPAAAGSGSAAATAATRANQAVSSAQQAQGRIQVLLIRARAAVAAWKKVHSAPRGVLGVTVQNPSPALGVEGCEVVTAEPASAAVSAGLVGETQSFDGLGDVITDLTDSTYANTTWRFTDCAALQAAMAETRVGDKVTITYLRSRNLVFATQWVRASGTAILGKGAAAGGGTATSTATASTTATSGSGPATSTATATATGTATASCPSPITGTITAASAGSRIELPIDLSGPGGEAPDLRAILDTGGVATSFPDGLLRQLGYHPYATTENSGVVPGATATAYLYHVPGSAITTTDGGRQVPLATGVLDVIGIPGGSNYTLGPDILENGSRLSTSGSRWTLIPPC